MCYIIGHLGQTGEFDISNAKSNAFATLFTFFSSDKSRSKFDRQTIFEIGDVQHHWPFGSDGEVKEADG